MLYEKCFNCGKKSHKIGNCEELKNKKMRNEKSEKVVEEMNDLLKYQHSLTQTGNDNKMEQK